VLESHLAINSHNGKSTHHTYMILY